MTSDHIMRLLKAKHSEDVFVPECKDGPTGAKYLRMDAWVMPRSWAHPAITAYEVKVSRQDFLNDKKWPGYLAYCNYLYFAAAPGIIGKEELPPEVGLLEASQGGARLFLRKKAQYRDVTIPEKVFRYVLMCRARITADNQGQSAREFWEERMASQIDELDFGHRVSGWIRRTVGEKVHAVECENKRLKAENERLQEFADLLKKLGINPAYFYSQQAEERIRKFDAAIPQYLEYCLENARRELENSLRSIKDARAKMLPQADPITIPE